MNDFASGAPESVRSRLVLPLDVGDLSAAEAVAKRLAPWFGIAKIGHELFAEAGPEAIERMHQLGMAVFCDLKLHD
ncbi:MAG: orotidine-5'-phosphate decarboxylase, partial [Actinobacteria bacterium]|nr:orotidine-5'-phosphate decarboxylase [Actinomycetota bacterium]